jgi:hypothetical protein
LKDGLLLPVGAAGRVPTFREFADGFWDFDKSVFPEEPEGAASHNANLCE